MEAGEINSKKFIILTGGEPLLQVDEKLINELKKEKLLYCCGDKWYYKNQVKI